MFSGSAVLWLLAVILQVLEHWSKSSAWLHTHAHTYTHVWVLWFFGFRIIQSGLRPLSVCNVFLFPLFAYRHTHTHTWCQVQCECLLLFSWCTPQPSVFRSSRLITSCFLFPTLLLPAHWATWIQDQRVTTTVSLSQTNVQSHNAPATFRSLYPHRAHILVLL